MKVEEACETLGVEEDEENDEEIAKAYRKKAAQLHPDRGGDEQAMRALVGAYESIKDSEAREKTRAGKQTSQPTWQQKLCTEFASCIVQADRPVSELKRRLRLQSHNLRKGINQKSSELAKIKKRVDDFELRNPGADDLIKSAKSTCVMIEQQIADIERSADELGKAIDLAESLVEDSAVEFFVQFQAVNVPPGGG